MKKSRYYVVDKFGNVTREMLYGSIFNGGDAGLSRGSYYSHCKPVISVRHSYYTGDIEPWIKLDRAKLIKSEFVFKTKKEAYEYLHDKLKKEREAIDEKIALVEKKLENLG
jgi:hypothetical protein